MKIKWLLSIILLILVTPVYSQKQASYWATIGSQIIDVSVHPPIIVGPSKSGQGWNAIADEQGKFLFYTNGSEFYDKNNKLIGKSGIEHVWGDEAVNIMPYPGKRNSYFVFFVGFKNNDPQTNEQNLYYTTVDLTLKEQVSSQSRILKKLQTNYNSLTSARTANCQSYWVLINSADSINAFYVDSKGINTNAVKSKVSGSGFVGYSTFKISPDGDHAARITREDGKINLEVFDFDKTNGTFSSRYKKYLKSEEQYFDYSLEFSPNSKNVFLLMDSVYNGPNPLIGSLTNSELWVYKIQSATIDEFTNSGILLYSIKGATSAYSNMQITPTGRIYLTFMGNNKVLSSINNPNAEKKEDFNFDPGKIGPYAFIYPPIFPSYYFQSLEYEITEIPAEAGNDQLACRDQSVVLGTDSQKGYTYSWESSGILNNNSISNPTLIAPKTPLPAYDTIWSFVTVNDSLCRQGIDSVKVIYKPALTSKINGSKSVCPGTKEVSYWIDNSVNNNFSWEVIGGVVSQNYSDSITVNWSVENFEAEVSVISVNSYGCSDLIDPFKVKIFKALETDTPIGPDTLSCDNRSYPYKIQGTNGSVYQWNILNGTIEQGNGSNQVLVNWNKDKKYGSIWIEESVNTELEICFGRSDTLFIVNPRSFGNENILLYSISSVIDEPQKLNIHYEIKDPFFYEPTSDIYWKPLAEVSWNEPHTLTNSNLLHQFDLGKEIDNEYLFQIRTKNICGEEVASAVNSNIFLTIEKDSINETMRLTWNKPRAWTEVTSYEIFLKKDDEPMMRYDSVPGNVLQKDIFNTEDGFQFEFIITGHSAESPFEANSNNEGVYFEHIPFIPNVITPNSDGFNDYFVIDKLSLYPENYLLILNRYGKPVYERVNYQNEWDASDLSGGVYYYLFKTTKYNRELKGFVHVIQN
jgi:gliding motility-associated-like protein